MATESALTTQLSLPTEATTQPADSPTEQADRTAIEKVWAEVWALYTRINQVAPDERAAQVEALMVDPIKSQLLQGAEEADAEGLGTYGQIVLHPYWYQSVNGQSTAVMGDCRDTSSFGEIDVATGDKKTVGVKASNTVGFFVRTDDGVWRVWDIKYVTDIPCEPVA